MKRRMTIALMFALLATVGIGSQQHSWGEPPVKTEPLDRAEKPERSGDWFDSKAVDDAQHKRNQRNAVRKTHGGRPTMSAVKPKRSRGKPRNWPSNREF